MSPGVQSFAELLLQWRSTLGLTQEELAEQAGLSTRAISDLERGVKRSPHRDTVQRLVTALDLSPEQRDAFVAAARRRIASRVASPPEPKLGPNNLPIPATPFLGRTQEIATASELLQRADVRLLTLTGPGGSGKTRLALKVAEALLPSFVDGVFFVPLDTISDPRLVCSEINHVLGVREVADRSLEDALFQQNRLLILDNFEHVLAASETVTSLLSRCPRLKILVTSRTPLGVAAEHELAVLPLPLPDLERIDPGDDLSGFDVVDLFVQRALAVKQDFVLDRDTARAIAEICIRLDGLPLAIELAAARSKLLSPFALLARLNHRLPLLTHGAKDAPARHHTLRGAIAWSYDLLDKEAQALLRRLSVFVRGFTLEAAGCVYFRVEPPAFDVEMLDRVAVLVDRSLVLQQNLADGEPRFTLLETIREFGFERLEAHGEVASTNGAHARFYAALARDAESHLTGPDQLKWFNRLEVELPNIRQALGWAMTHQAESSLPFVTALIRFWDHHSHLHEGRLWLETALAADPSASHSMRAKAYWGIGTLALVQGAYREAERALQIGLAEAEAGGDQYYAGFVLNGLGSAAQLLGDYARGLKLHEQGLIQMRAVGDIDGIAALLGNLGYGAFLMGDFLQSIERCEESLQLYRELESDHGMASMLGNLGRALLAHGELHRATETLVEGLQVSQAIGNKWYITVCLESLAGVAVRNGRLQRAVRLFAAVAKLSETSDVVLPPTDQALNERYLAMARTALDADTFESAWNSGYSKLLEDAIADALDGSGSR